MWLEMCMESFCCNDIRRLVPISYHIGSWKCVRKSITKILPLLNEVIGNLMNHFEALLVRVHGKSLTWMLSSNKKLDTHQICYVVMWVVRLSQVFRSILGTSISILAEIVGKNTVVRQDKLGIWSVSQKENCVLEKGFRCKGNSVLKLERPYGAPIYVFAVDE